MVQTQPVIRAIELILPVRRSVVEELTGMRDHSVTERRKGDPMNTHDIKSSMILSIIMAGLWLLVLFYSLVAVRGPMLVSDLRNACRVAEPNRSVQPIDKPSMQLERIAMDGKRPL